MNGLGAQVNREDILGLIEWTGWIVAPTKQLLPESEEGRQTAWRPCQRSDPKSESSSPEAPRGSSWLRLTSLSQSSDSDSPWWLCTPLSSQHASVLLAVTSAVTFPCPPRALVWFSFWWPECIPIACHWNPPFEDLPGCNPPVSGLPVFSSSRRALDANRHHLSPRNKPWRHSGSLTGRSRRS